MSGLSDILIDRVEGVQKMAVSVRDIMAGLDAARRHKIEACAAELIAEEDARRKEAEPFKSEPCGLRHNVVFFAEYRKRAEDSIHRSRATKPTQTELEAALEELADILTDDAPNIKNWITKRIAWHRQCALDALGLARPTADLEEDRIYDNLTYLEFRDLLDMLLIDGAMTRVDSTEDGSKE